MADKQRIDSFIIAIFFLITKFDLLLLVIFLINHYAY